MITETPRARVLGVDPGLTRTGWAVVETNGSRYRLVEAGVLAPASDGPIESRLLDAFEKFDAVIAGSQPGVVVMEDLFAAPRFPNAALKMAHLRGVLCVCVARAGIDLVSMTATTVKQRLTGNGHASKEQVQRMAFGLCDVAGQRVPADLSDAIALAIAGIHHLRYLTVTGR
jgi:crossover junction endodeoxyribonuclease RuvC